MLPTACPRSMLTASPTFSLASFRAFAACSKQSRARPAVRARPLWATWRAVPLRTRHLGRVESPASSQQCTRPTRRTDKTGVLRGEPDSRIARSHLCFPTECQRVLQNARRGVPEARFRRAVFDEVFPSRHTSWPAWVCHWPSIRRAGQGRAELFFDGFLFGLFAHLFVGLFFFSFSSFFKFRL